MNKKQIITELSKLDSKLVLRILKDYPTGLSKHWFNIQDKKTSKVMKAIFLEDDGQVFLVKLDRNLDDLYTPKDLGNEDAEYDNSETNLEDLAD